MKTTFFICAILLLSSAAFAAVPVSNDDKKPVRQFVPEDIAGDGDVAPGPGMPGMPQVCVDALMLLRCSCITGIEIAGIPPIPNVGPVITFINNLCAPAIDASLATLTVCNEFMLANAPNIMNSVSFTAGFITQCIPSAAGAITGAIGSFIAMR